MGMDKEGKICSCCLELKPLGDYSLTDRSGRRRAACKQCDYKREKIRKQTNGGCMNESKFKATLRGLSSIARKVYDVVPETTYWSSSRVSSELYANGARIDAKIVMGVLNTLRLSGLVIEADAGMFSRIKVPKAAHKQDKQNITEAPATIEPTTQKEDAVTYQEIQSNTDALREMSLKFMDMSASIQTLAVNIDKKATAIEKQMESSAKDNEKLKQLHTLLKSLG